MKQKILLLLLELFLSLLLPAQSDAGENYRNFPIVLTLQFHSLSMPFKDFKSSFSNIGVGLGTEVSLNGQSNWAQQLSLVWYRNQALGDGLLLYTQSAWRPEIASQVYTEIKAGAGYLYAFRPIESYRQEGGAWISAGRKGKGMLAIPLGISLGYDSYAPGTHFSPFVSYQFLPVLGYNNSIPVVPERLLQVGTRMHIR